MKTSVLLLIILTLFINSCFAQETSGILFPIVVNKKVGYVDRTGKIVIQPQFAQASEFIEGRAFVSVSDELKLSFIDETGKFITSPQFDNVRNFSEGLAAVGFGQFFLHGTGDHKWGFIDKSGNLVIKPDFRETREFSEGLAAVMNDERKWGFIDKSGKVVIPFSFEEAFSYSEGLACVLTDGLFGFIDKSGKLVIAPRYIVPARFKEGLAAVNIGDKNAKPYKYYGIYGALKGELQYIDKSGNTALKFDNNVEKIGDFSEGLALIEVKRKEKDFYKAFIDRTGKIKFELPFWGHVGNFSEGLAVVENNKKYGYIDETGKIIIKLKYSNAEDFRNGLAKVSVGKQVWDFEGTENLGFIPKSGYIDKTGKTIWKPTN